MVLTAADIKEDLTELLRVAVGDPKWSQTRLLNLPVVERQVEASRQVGVQPSEANLNLAIGVLQSVNQLTPAGPAPKFYDTWKMLIGAELNCLGAVRGYVAGALPLTRVPDSLKTMLRECAGQASFSAPEIAKAKLPMLKGMVRGAVVALWGWRTEQPLFEPASAEWEALLREFSREGLWTRDVTLKQRSLFIGELAQYLVSETAGSQPIGLGPHVFEAASAQTPLIPPSVGQSDSASRSNISKPNGVTELASPSAPIQSSAAVKPAKDTLDLYLTHVIPPAPAYIPDEWRAIIASATAAPRLFIQGSAGSGKTHLVYTLVHEVGQANLVPLYVPLVDYARQAANMDPLQFVAMEGAFWRAFHDEALSREFAQALAAAQRDDQLVVIADQGDDLFENEWSSVSRPLNQARRIVVVERTPHLPIERAASLVISMPALSLAALIELASTTGETDLHEGHLSELQQQGLELTPAVVSIAAQIARTTGDLHPVAIMSTWIDSLFQRVRSTSRVMAEVEQAHMLLQKLARIQQRLDWPHGEASDLDRETISRVFRDPVLQLKDPAEGWALLDFCARAGLLMRVGQVWQFASLDIEQFFAAEYAARETWTSMWPRRRQLMAWTTALLVRQGLSQPQDRFFAQLKLALERASDLSTLEALDILEQAGLGLPAAAPFKDEVLRRFKDLAKIESDAVRYAVQVKAERHGLDVGLTRKYEPPEALISGRVLDNCARDLPNLLSQLELKPPKGPQDQWLDNRNVLNALIEALRTQPDPLIRYQCAGWLRRSALSKTIEVQIPSQPWRSRTLSALEVLAEIAFDPSEDALAHALAKSVLAKEEFVLRLWKSRTEYVPLVYELLLALDKRLFAARPSSHQPDWYMSG